MKRKSVSNIVWGTALVILGVLFACDAMDFIDFHLFFKGWWTLFIIVPCIIGLVENKDKTRYIIGLGCGIMLLLSSQDIVSYHIISRLFWPFILIVIGLSLLGRNIANKKLDKFHRYQEYQNNPDDYSNYDKDVNDTNYKKSSNYSTNNYSESQGSNASYNDKSYYKSNEGLVKTYTNILSGRGVRYANEEFYGANITSILGGMDLDLRNAIITKDVVIEVNCILGGIDIYVPNNVKVIVNSTPILGGVDNKTISPIEGDYPIMYVYATCILGGMDIK